MRWITDDWYCMEELFFPSSCSWTPQRRSQLCPVTRQPWHFHLEFKLWDVSSAMAYLNSRWSISVQDPSSPAISNVLALLFYTFNFPLKMYHISLSNHLLFKLWLPSSGLCTRCHVESMLRGDKNHLSCPLIRDVSSFPLTIAGGSCGRGEIIVLEQREIKDTLSYVSSCKGSPRTAQLRWYSGRTEPWLWAWLEKINFRVIKSNIGFYYREENAAE